MPNEPAVSVVIPVYRAEQTLVDLYRQLSDAMSKLTSGFEIIFVEDGGGDGSWPIIESLARADHRSARHPRLKPELRTAQRYSSAASGRQNAGTISSR